MGYRLEQEELLGDGIVRIIQEQIDKALRDLDRTEENVTQGVHESRKRFKRIRAVLRLVRDEIGEEAYQRENVCFRDAGRRLSGARESTVLVATLDGISRHFAEQLSPDAFAHVRSALVDRNRNINERVVEDKNTPAEVSDMTRVAAGRVASWSFSHHDFSLIEKGLHRVYKRGRKAMAEAYAEPNAENFHEWRKRVKYFMYHVRILRPLWPRPIKALAKELDLLSDHLGDDHDLAELHSFLHRTPDMCGSEKEMEILSALIEQRREELQSMAHPIGERIYAQKPGALVDRFATYWQAWREDTAAKRQRSV